MFTRVMMKQFIILMLPVPMNLLL